MSYIYDIENSILNIIGLSIKNNYIYDDDNFDFLLYGNGMLKIANTGIFHRNDSVFDPIFSLKQIQYLFTVYTKKEEQDNGLYIQSLGLNTQIHQLDENLKASKYSLHVDTNKGTIDTSFYFNIPLAYIEAIYRISNIFDNDPTIKVKLKMTDFTEEQMIERLSKKGKR